MDLNALYLAKNCNFSRKLAMDRTQPRRTADETRCISFDLDGELVPSIDHRRGKNVSRSPMKKIHRVTLPLGNANVRTILTIRDTIRETIEKCATTHPLFVFCPRRLLLRETSPRDEVVVVVVVVAIDLALPIELPRGDTLSPCKRERRRFEKSEELHEKVLSRDGETTFLPTSFRFFKQRVTTKSSR